MQRPIKFRGWSRQAKVMVYEDEDHSSDYWDGVDVSPVEMVNEQLQSRDYEWMQFTGLRDRNGKEVFEGDIVSASIYSDEKASVLEVREEKGCFVIDYEDADSDFVPLGWFVGSIEVIGNLYENPELLEATP